MTEHKPASVTGDLAEQQHNAIIRGGAGALLSALCLMASALWLPSIWRFPEGTAEGLVYACQVSIVPGLVLMIAVRMVARIRFYSREDNPGSAFTRPGPRLAIPGAFLQNTLEQTVLVVIANLALASISSSAAMAYMTIGALLFVIGRITFLLGYRFGAGGRAFGMVVTMMPALGAYGWVLYAWVF